MINVHTGVDFWTLDESVKFFELCQEHEKSLKTPVAHETHR